MLHFEGWGKTNSTDILILFPQEQHGQSDPIRTSLCVFYIPPTTEMILKLSDSFHTSPLLPNPKPNPSIPFCLVSRRDMRIQHPGGGVSVRGGGAERDIWRGPAEGPRPGGLWVAEGVHLHYSGSWLWIWPRGSGGQEVAQVSDTQMYGCLHTETVHPCRNAISNFSLNYF